MWRQVFNVILIGPSLFFYGCSAQLQSSLQGLTLISSVPLPHVAGRIDHLDYDYSHQLLFVAELGNNTVEVVDLKAAKVIHRINNLKEPQGVAYIPGYGIRGAIFISNGESGECAVFDAASWQNVASINLSRDADNVRYDSALHKIYTGYGDGGIAIINSTDFKLVSKMNLDGHPESFQIDRTANKIYVNVPDNEQIEIVDLEKGTVTDKWKLTEAKSNYPMCLDEMNHRLFVGCRNPSRLLVINTETGKTVASLPIDNDVDDISYYRPTSQLFLSCGSGYIDILSQLDQDTYMAEGKITTQSGARTSLLIPQLNQLIVASPAGVGHPATLFVYKIKK